MLIVIVLISTAAGFSIRALRSYREVQRAQAGAVQLVEVLTHAKSRAVTANQVVVVDFAPGSFNPADGFYEVFVDLNRDAVRDSGEVVAARLADPTMRGGLIGYQLPARMKFDRPDGATTGPLGIGTVADGVTFIDDKITLFPDGTASEAGHLTFEDPYGRTFAVTVTVGGAVRMYRWDGSSWR